MVCPNQFTLIYPLNVKNVLEILLDMLPILQMHYFLNYLYNTQSILIAKNFKVTQKSKGPIDHHPQTWLSS